MYKKASLALCAFMTILFFACKKDDNNNLKAALAVTPTLQGTYQLIDEQGEWWFIVRSTDNGNVDSTYWTAGYLTTNNGGQLTIDANRFYFDSVYYYVDTTVVNSNFHNGVLVDRQVDKRIGMTVDYHISAPYTLISPDSVSLTGAGIETILGTKNGFHLSWSGDTLTMFNESSVVIDTTVNGESFYEHDYQSLKRRYLKK